MRVTSTRRVVSLALMSLLVMLLFTMLNSFKNTASAPFKVLVKSDDDLVEEKSIVDRKEIKNTEEGNSTNFKYILQWTSPNNVPLMFMGKGREGFIERKCPYTNCYVTGDRKYLGGDYTKFDVIVFSGPEVIRMSKGSLPQNRSPHQKYAFASIESSDYYPVCSNKLDGFFNWTWTFRLDPEVRWGYMVIRDKDGNAVGPNKEMNWLKLEEMEPVSEEFKRQLQSKTKAAALFVSNCHSRSKREDFVKKLQKELEQYDLTVDVYGKCGPLKCSRADETACFNLIKEKYFFYLSFENSFSEDYVTEKLLNAVQNDAVPIVFGDANYSRFIPDGAYLNARILGPEDLASKMNYLIKNPDEYYEYFRWKNHYSYHRKMDSVETDEYCLFCKILNDEHMVKERMIYQKFREWWDPPQRC